MTKQRSQIISILLVIFNLWLMLGANAGADPALEGQRYETSLAFACGSEKPSAGVISRQDVYIRFRNPHKYPVMLNNLLVFAAPEGAKDPEFGDRYLNVLISPEKDFEMNCATIGDLFYPEEVDAVPPPKSFSGEIRSRSIRYLEIAIEYVHQSRFKEAMRMALERMGKREGETIPD